MSIKQLSNEELRYGIDRTKARLAGIMPMGILSTERAKSALKQYRAELRRRGEMELEFSDK